VAIDDCSRVAYLEVHADEQAQTVAGFAGRALALFAGVGVSVERLMTDNGSGYRFSPVRRGPDQRWNDRSARLLALARHQRQGQTAESDHRAEMGLCQGVCQHQARLADLPAWLHHYNHHGSHRALNRRSPMRLLNNLPGSRS
jgi:transposase InsO family protein